MDIEATPKKDSRSIDLEDSPFGHADLKLGGGENSFSHLSFDLFHTLSARKDEKLEPADSSSNLLQLNW